MTVRIMNESFSIQFIGEAFGSNEISASALAQSLLALDGLAKKAAEVEYGKDSEAEIKVKAGFRKGSFIIDLIARCQSNPEAAANVGAAAVTIGAGVVGLIKSVFKLGKFSRGEKITAIPKNETEVSVRNEIGETSTFNLKVVNIYNSSRVQSQLSRLTQTLDLDGAESIKIYTDNNDEQAETITKEERRFFRREDGIVLTDNEAEVILEIIGPMMDGSSKGWKFSEGTDGIDFFASVEDEDFLSKVKSRAIKFENGTAIRAILRTVQRKNIRTVTDRSIVEVKEVIPPSKNLF